MKFFTQFVRGSWYIVDGNIFALVFRGSCIFIMQKRLDLSQSSILFFLSMLDSSKTSKHFSDPIWKAILVVLYPTTNVPNTTICTQLFYIDIQFDEKFNHLKIWLSQDWFPLSIALIKCTVFSLTSTAALNGRWRLIFSYRGLLSLT